jgi:protein KTI12
MNSGAEELCMELSRPVLLPELRRHKRAFMKLTTQHDAAKLQGAAAAKRLFVDYLMEHLD